MRRSPRSGPTIARSVVAVALAALLLVEGIASTLHTATVRHAVCPEHGELLDVAHRPAAEPPSCEPGPSVQGEDSHDDAHDACAFVLLDPARRWEFHGDLVLLGLAKATVIASSTGQPEGRLAVPRILFAPKHSPPA
jgi:hypothetical protein